MGQESTGHLLEATLGGEETAKGDLLERLRPRLVLWAATRLSPALRTKVDPEDLAQDVLLNVHEGLGTFRGTERRSFFAWVFTIAENRLRDLCDHHGALKRKLPTPTSLTVTSPSTAAARDEQVTRVHEALARLAPDHQEVIRLRRLQGLPLKEVAEILGRSVNAVSTLYFRAVLALRKELRK